MKDLQLLIISTDGFPKGMAVTQRMLMMSKAVNNCGIKTKIFCIRVTERKGSIKNKKIKGIYEGIEYEYTTGSTVRANNFFLRRLIELWGLIKLFYRITVLRCNNNHFIICLWITIQKITLTRILILLYALLLRITVIQEVCELPWNYQLLNNFVEKRLSPLFGLDGVIVISGYLEELVKKEAMEKGKNIGVLRVPILADVLENKCNVDSQVENNLLVYSASQQYVQSLIFVINSMNFVWKVLPDVRLCITGFSIPQNMSYSQLKKILDNRKINVLGYLKREELLLLYSSATLLLAPLFNDLKSKARFPTKIAEYLSSGRPVLTSDIGEINDYFIDGENAFISKAESVDDFAGKILEVLNNPDLGNKVGMNGRKTAIENFYYRNYSNHLHDFLLNI